MPSDAVGLEHAPAAAIVWLLQGGLLPEQAEHVWGMRWHDATKRLMMPVFNASGEVTGMLGRGVAGERPKYKAYFGTASLYFATSARDSMLVVCEDILSAIAIRNCGYSAVAIMGTSISPTDAREIANWPLIAAWFDPDTAGEEAWPRFRKRMGLYPVATRRITSEYDPKLLPRQTIKDKLNAVWETGAD